jgi:GR25 family glycosyltransferase involved in LPS biosynthesis
LKKSKDRIDLITKNFKKLNIPFERFNAIYGKELDYSIIKDNTTFLARNLLCNYGVIGCAMSHFKVWEEFKERSNEEFILICEDDIEFTEEFKKINDTLIQNIYNKTFFDILSLNCSIGLTGSFRNNIELDNIKIYYPIFPLTMACYIVSKKGVDILLKIFTKVNYHIDFEIAVNNLFSDFIYCDIRSPDFVKVSRQVESNISDGLNKGIVLKLLNSLGLHDIGWFLNNSAFTLFLKGVVTIYSLILIILVIFGVFKKFYFFILIVLLELCITL